MAMSVVIMNGPSLNLLGVREPEIYGRTTLAEIEEICRARADRLGLSIALFGQTNYEGQMIDWIHLAREIGASVIINPGSWASSSTAIADGLKILQRPVMEVHLSNIHRRGIFQHGSLVSQTATGIIAGLGYHGYLLAMDALAEKVAMPHAGTARKAT